MADFDKTWPITSSWEGPLGSSTEHSDEEKFGTVKWGTNFGLTGTYMRDYTPWKASDRDAFIKMNRADCGKIWEATRWKWLKGEQIEQQEMANLLFDWGVRRWNSLINGVRIALGQPIALREENVYLKDKKGNFVYEGKEKVILKYKGGTLIGQGDAYSTLILCKSAEIGGKPADPNQGFFILTDLAIQELNARAKMPNTNFHALLKSLRQAKDKPTTQSIKDRYNSFFNQGTPTKDEWERMRDKGVPVNLRTKGVDLSQYSKKRGLIIENQPQLQDGDSDEDNTVRNLLIGLGVAKLLKIW